MTFVDPPSDPAAVGRICETVAGDLERFRERPRISTVLTAASPLQIDGPALDHHIALARHGVPVNVYSMAIAGATSPVTLAGSVVEGVAEFLGAATALQVAAPGARLVFCFGSGVLDMLQTTFSIGSLESAQMGAMAAEVGHYIGVPTLHPGISTDAKHPGLQAGYEKALKLGAVCSANPDIVTGWGLIDSHNTMYLPQSVVDNEMAGMARRLYGEVEVSEATLAATASRRRRPGRRLPRRARDRQAHPGRRALPADGLRPLLLREVGRDRPHRERHGRARRWSGCSPGTRSGRAWRRRPSTQLAAVCGVDDDLRRRALRD